MGNEEHFRDPVDSNAKSIPIRKRLTTRRFPALLLAILLCSAFFLVRSHKSITSWSRLLRTTDDSPHAASRTNNVPGSCLELRGSSGKWIQDWSYASRTAYTLFGNFGWHRAQQNFTPTPGQPFRNAASWTWQDDHCPVSEVTLPGWCRTSYELNVSQYLILGDSMSAEMFHSLQGLLLGLPPMGPQARFPGHLLPVTVACPATEAHPNFNLTHLFFQSSPLKDMLALRSETETYQRDSSTRGVARQFIENGPSKTVVVANTGAWMRSPQAYQRAFDALLFWIDSLDAEKVIVLYRETIPGHGDCKPNNSTTSGNSTGIQTIHQYNWKEPVEDRPFHNYTEYLQVKRTLHETAAQRNTVDIVYLYNWELFEDYNAYAKKLLLDRRSNGASNASSAPQPLNNTGSSVPVHLLNVFNSSVLRRDGHMGFGDCLHYYLPGPPDWWSHFLYSALLDLVARQEHEKQAGSGSNSGGAALL